MSNELKTEQKAQAVSMLCEGNSIRAVEGMIKEAAGRYSAAQVVKTEKAVSYQPLQPLTPLRPSRPLAPVGGWSELSFQEWLMQECVMVSRTISRPKAQVTNTYTNRFNTPGR